jgi:GDP-4-dehydro-6-deoxy-D-mannose reductase
MARRILITGATGFVGTHLLRQLEGILPREDKILATGRRATLGWEEGRAAYHQIDLNDHDAVQHLIKTFRPTHTVHLAALSSVHQALGTPAETWRTNVCGTLNLAEALASHTADGNLIFISTSEVYGRSFAGGERINETAPLAPANPYARSKAAAEGAALDASLHHRVVVLRAFNHTGPGQDERFVVASFAAQIARIELGLAEPVLRVGDLSAERDFLDVEDVTRAYAAIILHSERLPPRSIFNIASGVPRKIAGIVEHFTQKARCAFSVEVDEARKRPSEIPRALGSADAIRKAIGWQPEIPWETTLERVLDDWRTRLVFDAHPGILVPGR